VTGRARREPHGSPSFPVWLNVTAPLPPQMASGLPVTTVVSTPTPRTGCYPDHRPPPDGSIIRPEACAVQPGWKRRVGGRPDPRPRRYPTATPPTPLATPPWLSW
jgi:hypothetical protein